MELIPHVGRPSQIIKVNNKDISQSYTSNKFFVFDEKKVKSKFSWIQAV